MTLAIAIETNAVDYGVAVFDGRDVLAHRTIRRDTPEFTSIGALAADVIAETGREFADLGLVVVDAGPGNLTSVRAGIAYANGLAFAVGCSVVPVDALRLLARAAVGKVDEPVLCLHKPGGGRVYAGLFRPGTEPVLRHAPLETVVPELSGELPSVSAAGRFRDEVRQLLPGTAVKDTGIDTFSVLTLHDVVTDPDGPAPEAVLVASPLTETSAVFA